MEEREVLSCLLSLGVAVFIVSQHHKLKAIPFFRILLTSFALLLLSFNFSVVEGFFWESGLNFLQHLCSGLSAILLAVWCWLMFVKKPEKESRP